MAYSHKLSLADGLCFMFLVMLWLIRALYLVFLNIRNGQELLEKAMDWQYFYNLVRPHYGTGMNGKMLFEKLKDLSYDLFALFSHLDTISTNWLLETGNDLLAHYSNS